MFYCLHSCWSIHRTRVTRGGTQEALLAEDVEEASAEQAALLASADLRYIGHRLTLERSKIAKLKGGLHLTDAGASKHLVFVDSKEEGTQPPPPSLLKVGWIREGFQPRP